LVSDTTDHGRVFGRGVSALKLYYETPDGRAKLYLGDCLDVMRALPDGHVDLVFADPPYKEEWPAGWLIEARRISRRTLLVTPGIGNVGRLPPPDWILAWIKKNACSRTKCGFNCWEPIFVYGWPKRGGAQDIYEASIGGEHDAGGHPWPKPKKLMLGLVQDFSQENDLVLDPFAGSGTTCLAAYRLGRRTIGIDIKEEYLEMAKKRLLQGVLL